MALTPQRADPFGDLFDFDRPARPSAWPKRADPLAGLFSDMRSRSTYTPPRRPTLSLFDAPDPVVEEQVFRDLTAPAAAKAAEAVETGWRRYAPGFVEHVVDSEVDALKRAVGYVPGVLGTVVGGAQKALGAGATAVQEALQNVEPGQSRIRVRMPDPDESLVETLLSDLAGRGYDSPGLGRLALEGHQAIQGAAEAALPGQAVAALDVTKPGALADTTKLFEGRPGLAAAQALAEGVGEMGGEIATDPFVVPFMRAGQKLAAAQAAERALPSAATSAAVADAHKALAAAERADIVQGAIALPSLLEGAAVGGAEAVRAAREHGVVSPEAIRPGVGALFSALMAGAAGRDALRTPGALGRADMDALVEELNTPAEPVAEPAPEPAPEEGVALEVSPEAQEIEDVLQRLDAAQEPPAEPPVAEAPPAAPEPPPPATAAPPAAEADPYAVARAYLAGGGAPGGLAKHLVDTVGLSPSRALKVRERVLREGPTAGETAPPPATPPAPADRRAEVVEDRRAQDVPVATEKRSGVDRRALAAELQLPEDHPAVERLAQAEEGRAAADERADTDPITGLQGARAWEQAVAEAEKAGHHIVSMDATGLGWVNDHLGGHATGNNFLKMIGQAMAEEPGVRSFHPHGDEFGLIAETPEAAEAAARSIQDRIARARFTAKLPDGRTVTYEGGRIDYGHGPTESAADTALYAAKEESVRKGHRAPGKGQRPPGLVEIAAEGRGGDHGAAAPQGVEAPPPFADWFRAQNVPPGDPGAIREARERYMRTYPDADRNQLRPFAGRGAPTPAPAPTPREEPVDVEGIRTREAERARELVPDEEVERDLRENVRPTLARKITPADKRLGVHSRKPELGLEGFEEPPAKLVDAINKDADNPTWLRLKEARRQTLADEIQDEAEVREDTEDLGDADDSFAFGENAPRYAVKPTPGQRGLDGIAEDRPKQKEQVRLATPAAPRPEPGEGRAAGYDRSIETVVDEDGRRKKVVVDQGRIEGTELRAGGAPLQTEGMEARGPLFQQEEATRAREAASAQTDLFRDAAPVAEGAPPSPPEAAAEQQGLFQEAQAAPGRIEDFGEKIGGARKDTARPLGQRGARQAEADERPAWMRKYRVFQDANAVTRMGDAAPWTMVVGDRIVYEGGRPREFATKAAAERAIPLYEVSRNHRVYQDRAGGKFSIVRLITDRKRAVVRGGFETEEAAKTYMAQHPEEIIERKFDFPEKPWLDRIERVGKDRRGGKDVTTTAFRDTFGFRGGEFGNWNMGSDGQASLNHAYDALLDLADALGVPPRALSLDGELAIAFGARGHGGKDSARAHYEPDRAVINLTKIKGAGSLAHEWFHAMDHYFAKQGMPAGKATRETVTAGFSGASTVRPEMREAFKDVVRTFTSKEETAPVDAAVADKRVGNITDWTRRTLDDLRRQMGVDMSAYNRRWKPPSEAVLKRWDEVVEQIMRGEPGKQQHIPGQHRLSIGRYSFDAIEELNSLFKSTTGRSFATAQDHSQGRTLFHQITSMLDARKRMAEASEGATETRRRPSDYLQAAKEIDSLRASDYWSIPTEMGARAFESFIYDRLKGRGERSDYLAAGVENKGYAMLRLPTGGPMKPYPEGAEREAINSAFERLFQTVQTRETEKGTALYKAGQAAAAPAGITRENVARAFPTGKVADVADGRWLVDLPGGVQIRVDQRGEIAYLPEAFKAGYGRELGDEERIVGAWNRIGRGGIIQLAKEGGDQETLDHEAFHAAMDLALTPKERKSVLKHYGDEEGAANSYARWKPRERPNTLFQKILTFFRNIYRSFNPTWESAFERVRSGDAFGKAERAPAGAGEAFATRAFHGSPHDFDRFSMEKIGTGEGAQVYGHGLYFASRKDVADHYRDRLSEARYKLDGEGPYDLAALRASKGLSAEEREVLDALMSDGMQAWELHESLEQKAQQYERAADRMRPGDTSLDPKKLAMWQDEEAWQTTHAQAARSLLKRTEKARAGRLYEVELSPDEHEFLDWDRPLSQQSDQVREILERSGLVERKRSEPTWFDSSLSDPGAGYFLMRPGEGTLAELRPGRSGGFDVYHYVGPGGFTFRGNYPDLEMAKRDVLQTVLAAEPREDPWSTSGGMFYRREAHGNERQLSRVLREAGIPGIKFKDGFSRKDGGPATHNYVIFDDSLIETKAKYATRPGAKAAEPTPAQVEAGNYRKGHERWAGFDVSIETPKGGTRTAKDGSWSVEDFPADYGYIRRTEGKDGEQVDVYLGDERDSETVYVVDQVDPKRNAFDEHKVMAGFASREDALAAYDRAFDDGSGPSRRGAVTEMPVAEFKTWVREGDTKKPVAWSSSGPKYATRPIRPIPPGQQQLPGAPPAGGGQPPRPPRVVQMPLPGTQPSGFRMPAETLTDKLVRTWQDKFHRVKQTVETVKAQGGTVMVPTATGRADVDPYLAIEQFDSKTAERLRDVEREYADPLIKTLTDHGLELEDLDQYLYARHAPERNSLIEQRTDGQVTDGSGMTDAEASTILADFGRRGLTAKLQKAEALIRKIRDEQIRVQLDGGLISRDQAKGWRAALGDSYVPLRSFEAHDGAPVATGLGRGFDIRGKEAKSALGRGSKADSPTSFLLTQLQQAIVRAEKNRVAQTFAAFVKANPDPQLWEIDKAHTKRALGEDGKVTDQPDPIATQNDYDYKVNGEQHRITIHDPLLDRAMKNLSASETNRFLETARNLTGMFSAINTTLAPEFVATNFVRDVQTALGNVSADHGRKAAQATLKNIPQALKGMHQVLRNPKAQGQWAQHAREFRQDGGPVGFYGEYFRDPEAQAKHVSRKVAGAGPGALKAINRARHRALDTVKRVNETVENGTRLAAYVAMRDAGMSRKRAASVAKNLTVNFNRKGEIGPTLSALYAFANASIQGTARFAALAKRPVGRKILAGLAGGAFALDQFNRAMAGDADDDGTNDWDAIPDYVKERNLVVMTGEGNPPVMIPFAHTFNLAANMGRLVSATLSGAVTPSKAAVSMAGATVNAFNPLGGDDDLLDSLTPTFLRPIEQQQRNRDFAGRQIVPEQFPGAPEKPDSEMFYKNVPPVARMIARALNAATGGDEVTPGYVSVSPETMAHYWDAFLGGMGRFGGKVVNTLAAAAKGEDITPRNVPFAGRFVYEPSPGQAGQRYRENAQELDNLHMRHKHYMETGQYAKAREMPQALLRARKQLESIDRQIRAKKKAPATPSAEEQIAALQRRANKIVADARRAAEAR